MKNDILIVDAYNMIGNWPDLNHLKLTNRLEEARDRLLDMLSEYRKYQQIQIIVVFDAMFVPGISKRYTKYGLDVVWTGQDQTADAYIEALAKEKQTRFTHVTVATSDQAEQWMIFFLKGLYGSLLESYYVIFNGLKKRSQLPGC